MTLLVSWNVLTAVSTLSIALDGRRVERKTVGREKLGVFVLKYGKMKINRNSFCSKCLFYPEMMYVKVTLLITSSMRPNVFYASVLGWRCVLSRILRF